MLHKYGVINLAFKPFVGSMVVLLLLAALPNVSASEETSEPPALEQPTPATDELSVPLSSRLRFVVRPTIFGLVPPPDPANYGEVFVRVREVGVDGSLKLYYEIKEEVPVKRDDDKKTSRRKPKPQTIIRRGLITSRGATKNSQIFPPLFWQNGDFETQSRLLWLTRQEFSALKLSAKAPWKMEAASEMPKWAKEKYQLALQELSSSTSANATSSPVLLEVVNDSAKYPILVNGARVRLPAILVADSLGFAEYWILDDPHNPLVLKLTYISGQMPGSSNAADGYSIFSGGGFAIVELNY